MSRNRIILLPGSIVWTVDGVETDRIPMKEEFTIIRNELLPPGVNDFDPFDGLSSCCDIVMSCDMSLLQAIKQYPELCVNIKLTCALIQMHKDFFDARCRRREREEAEKHKTWCLVKIEYEEYMGGEHEEIRRIYTLDFNNSLQKIKEYIEHMNKNWSGGVYSYYVTVFDKEQAIDFINGPYCDQEWRSKCLNELMYYDGSHKGHYYLSRNTPQKCIS